MTTACALKFPDGLIPEFRDIFCKLQETEWAFDPSEYVTVDGATRTGHPTIPLNFTLNTTHYANHPTEVYSSGAMTLLDQYTGGTAAKVGVSFVESVGNGDQGSFWNDNAKYGNLYLLTSPGRCQDLSPDVAYTSWRYNDFDQSLRAFHFVQARYNGKGPEISLFGFPKSVADAKKNPPLIVTVLPGPSATHVPSGQEGLPGAIPQGEWPLAWSAVTYTPAKLTDLVSAGLPLEFQFSRDRCSRVVQGHSDSTPIIQFTWNIDEVMRQGALAVAHDIGNFMAVLRDNTAQSTPSVLKITLVRM